MDWEAGILQYVCRVVVMRDGEVKLKTSNFLRSGQHYLFLGNQQPHSRSSKSQEIAFFSAIQDLHSRFFLEFSEFNNTIFHILTSPSSSVEFNTIFSHSYRRA